MMLRVNSQTMLCPCGHKHKKKQSTSEEVLCFLSFVSEKELGEKPDFLKILLIYHKIWTTHAFVCFNISPFKILANNIYFYKVI